MKKQIYPFRNFICLLKNYLALGSLTSTLLLATAPAAAQDDLTDEDSADVAGETEPASEETEPASEEIETIDAGDTDAGSAPEVAEAPDDSSTLATASPSATADTSGTEGAAEATVPSDSEDSEKDSNFLDAVGIRKLTGDAYPTYKTRGIIGGSLWRTFHGLQWPYMPQSGIGVSGTVWVDTGYEKIDRHESSQPTSTYVIQEGRAVLRMTPTYTRNNWFIQGQAELVANKDQNVSQPQVGDTDDLWVRVGKWHAFDVQAGRFEAWELYHLGMGLDLNTQERRGAFELNSGLTVPDIYGVTDAYYRPSGPGNIAGHFYPVDFFRFEVLGQVGNDGGLNTTGVRIAGILDFGFLKLKGGGEYKKQMTQLDQGKERREPRGFGGTAQFIVKEFVEFGGSYGWTITDHMDNKGYIDEEGSYTKWSAGGFVNLRIIKNLLFGAGGHYTFFWDTHTDEENKVGKFAHLQAFGAIQYLLMERLYIKVVGAFAQGDFDPSFAETDPYTTRMISGRLRLQYDF
ncbi:MAG: hypothetical protein JXX29_20235 [Deltaproteobacteria bacterium]|nr:hypothetical protein [Deltaproteobacteria bacterium]MBN2674022.1 hypothetical protein [Deltaproteobacteria bacterium]